MNRAETSRPGYAVPRMRGDVRGSAEYEAVAEHLRRWHEPGFGRPHLLAEPDVTADGSRVAVTGSVFDELTGRPRTAVYTVADGELTAVTGGSGSARCGRFAPDGRRLAFLSDRAGAASFQLYLLGAGLGEAVAAPAVPGTVESAHWSPGGDRILLLAAGPGAALAGAQGSGANAGAEGELPDWHPLFEDGTPPEAAGRSLWLYDVEYGRTSRLSPEGMNCWETAWCGDGRVLAVTSDSAAEDSWYAAVLTLIDVRTGEHRTVLRSDVQLGWPAGSPDGGYAAVVQAVCSDRMLVAGELTVVDLEAGGETRVGTAGTDVTWTQWLDAGRLGYLGLRHLDSVAGIADIRAGTVSELFSTPEACGGGAYPDGAFTADGRVVVVQHGYRLPPQLAVRGGDAAGAGAGDGAGAGGEDRAGDRSGDGAGGEVLASTAHPGTGYLMSAGGTAEPVTWRAPDGLEIEGLLYTPDGPGPHPLVLNVHGGPVLAFRNAWPASYPWVPLLVSRGYAVLNPNPRGSAGRGQDFAARVVGDMGGADTHDYLSGIDALVARGVADPDRLAVLGGSYGGFMSSWLVTQDRRFAAAVPMCPVTDWYSFGFTSNIGGWSRDFLRTDLRTDLRADLRAGPESAGGQTQIHTRSPVLHAGKVRTPCLNVAGGADRCTPPDQAREFHQALLAHGNAESVLVTYPLEGHGVRSYPAVTDLLTRVLTWFDGHLKQPGQAAGSPSAQPDPRERTS